MIVFHGIKLAGEDKGLGLHVNEMRRCLLEGNVEMRRAIQTKLLPKMFKSVELRNILNSQSMVLLSMYLLLLFSSHSNDEKLDRI